MKKEKICISGLVLLVLVVMVGAAELLHDDAIIFPEITAITIGMLLAPQMGWQTNKLRMFICVVLGAVLGLGISVFMPGPLWLQMTVAYALAQVVFLLSGTTFAPLIASMLFPVLFQLQTVVYIIAAPLLTLLVIACRLLVEHLHYRAPVAYTPVRPSQQDWRDAAIRLVLMAVISWLVVFIDARFVIAPPLLVAFTEFSRRGNKARLKPVKAVITITLCALAGAACRYVFAITLNLPLVLAALVAGILIIIIISNMKMYIPPAAALGVLPMVIPADKVIVYPLQILIGAAVYMLLAKLVFPNKTA